MKTRLFALSLIAFVSGAMPAMADGVVDKIMTAADKKRLAEYEQTRKAAIAEARTGLPDEVAQLNALLAKRIVPFDDFDMTGNWQCRTIKAGGLAQLVVYGWFKCKVTDDGSGWTLLKTTGSQRTNGKFYTESDKRLIYLGSGFVAGDPIKPYGDGPKSDQVGYAFRTGTKEWRIEFPAPYYESKLDILEFRR